jgi:hypothetical protein
MFSKTKNKRARIFVCSGISHTVLHVVAVVDNLAVVSGYWLFCIFSKLFLLDSVIYLFIFGVFKDTVSSSDYTMWVSE